MEVKRITKRDTNSRRKMNHNRSGSFVNLLSKNIERMRKNNREFNIKITAEVDFKPILSGKAFMQSEDINTLLERLHTTP
jgi:hypothetical protein